MSTEHDTEVWLDVKGYEGIYQVSNHGRVKSLNRTERVYWKNTVAIRTRRGRTKKLTISDGYFKVALSKNRISKTMAVHRLVLEAFVGPCPEGMECCHKDGNRKNNHVKNLRWGTRQSNVDDKYKHGTIPFGKSVNAGESNGMSRVRIECVRKIREMYSNGIRAAEIARILKEDYELVRRIAKRKRWGNVE